MSDSSSSSTASFDAGLESMTTTTTTTSTSSSDDSNMPDGIRVRLGVFRRRERERARRTWADFPEPTIELPDDETIRMPEAVEESDEEELLPGVVREKCCICLRTYRESDTLRQLPCGHVFHDRCVSYWLRRQQICPVCRMVVIIARRSHPHRGTP
ncbi:uncharacterized protein LOC135383934 [Ornithodoros turicata]|uniref:uncharacterized protein LOC135383934 n=1 Tax=Ornithodoros turicata TaxID=34597 RepID=UPI0031394392